MTTSAAGEIAVPQNTSCPIRKGARNCGQIGLTGKMLIRCFKVHTVLFQKNSVLLGKIVKGGASHGNAHM